MTDDSNGVEAPAHPPWEDPRRVLRRHQLAPKRAFSQNFLVSQSAVERIAEAAAAADAMRVVELGPGLGTLTAALLRRRARVIAVERDHDMREVLAAEFGARPDLDVVSGDAANVDLTALAGGTPLVVAGNLPYAITGAILRNLVVHRGSVSRAVLMVQREVRDRLLADPGGKTYGALTVFTQASFVVTSLLRVPRTAFHPAPKVDSAVVILTPHPTPRAVESDMFRKVVRAAFDGRRKTLRNALIRQGGLNVERVDLALDHAGIDGTRRGETLTVEEFARLATGLTP